jgi:dTDP-4-dehydrorhamnose 3,5-epimerase
MDYFDKAKQAKYESKPRIQGVVVKQLVMHCDEGGGLMEMLRADDPFFNKFGQAYVSITYPGVVKAWHYHKKQTDYMVVVKGQSKIVLYDAREDSPTKGIVNEFFLGEDNHIMVSIPPGVLHGQKPYGREPSYLINFPSEPFNIKDPDEYRLDPFDESIPYDWELKQG